MSQKPLPLALVILISLGVALFVGTLILALSFLVTRL